MAQVSHPKDPPLAHEQKMKAVRSSCSACSVYGEVSKATENKSGTSVGRWKAAEIHQVGLLYTSLWYVLANIYNKRIWKEAPWRTPNR